MGKLLKILLQIIAAFLLLIILAAIVLPFIIDPNDFKPQITAAVEKSTGRTLTIPGDLKLSVFPWLGVSTGKMSLSNPPGYDGKPFASIEESDLKVKLIPLLSSEIEVSRIVLKGLVLNLAKNVNGIGNWQVLTSETTSVSPQKSASSTSQDHQDTAEQDDQAPATPAIVKALVIGGLSIENAAINWDDQRSNKHVAIKAVNLKTNRLTFNQPVAIDLSLEANHLLPEIAEKLSLKADLTINEDLQSFTLKQLVLDLLSEGSPLPGGKLSSRLSADIAVNLDTQNASITDLQFTSAGLNLSADLTGSNIKDAADFKGTVTIAEFNLRTTFSQLGMTMPQTRDKNALSRLSGQFDLHSNNGSISLNDLAIKLDQSSIKGSASITDFAQPALAFKLNIDTLDVDRYLPSKAQKTSPSTAQKAIIQAESKPSVPATTEPEAKVKPATNSTVAAKPITDKTAEAGELPIASLRTLNANGELFIGHLKFKGLKMRSLNLQLQAAKGIVKTQHTIKHLYQGSSSGSVNLDITGKQPAFIVNETLTSVQVEPLLKDLKGKAKLSGTVDATAKIRARGNSERAIKSTLNGQGKFLLRKGIINGFNLHRIIAKGEKIIGAKSSATDNSKTTAFSEISGSADIVNGLVKNDDLFAKSDSLRVNGQGTADLVSEKLDYKVAAKLLKSEANANAPEQVKRAVDIDVAGTFAQPSYTVDLTSLITEREKRKLYDKVEKKLGPGVSDLLKKLLK